jgi:hypothetical protein
MTNQRTIQNLPLDTPVPGNKSSPKNLGKRKNPNASSQVLRDFHNYVQSRSQLKTVTTYHWNTLRACLNEEANSAIVLSRAAGHEILVLRDDHTLQV